MKDNNKTKEQLINELNKLRKRIAVKNQSDFEYEQDDGFAVTWSDVTKSKQKEMKLNLQSEILINISEGVYLIRADDGIIVYTNPNFEVMFGYEHGEMIGKHVSIVNAPTEKSPEETAKEIIEVIEKKGLWKGEIKNIRKDGTLFWSYASVSPFDHPDYGRVWVVIHTDTTERKKIEEELENIFTLSPDMVAVCTTEGKFLKVNPSWEKVLGYTQKELLSLGWNELVHPDDIEKTNKEVENQLKGSSVINFCNRYKCKDGSYKTLEWQATFAKEGIVYATARDITARKKIEENLKLSEEKYQDLFDYAPDMYCSVDAKTATVIRCNQTLVRQTGYTKEEIIGNSIFDRYHPDSMERAKKAFHSFVSKGEVHNAELQLKKKGGGKIDVSLNVSSVRDENGNILYSRSNWRDITKRKRVEKALKKSEQEIHKFAEHLQSVREKERALVASELHDEVGQALTGLKMDLFMIKNKMFKDKKEIPGQFQRMEKLLDDSIQKLRKIYSDLRPSLLEHFGIGEAIKQFVTDSLEPPGIKYTFYQDPEEIILDENRSIALYRILQGAINNIKWHAMATKVDIRLEEKGPNLKLTIRDNGKGIKEEQINNGESFGLIGMRERARFLEGELDIKGIPDKGTTIKLEIPIK